MSNTNMNPVIEQIFLKDLVEDIKICEDFTEEETLVTFKDKNLGASDFTPELFMEIDKFFGGHGKFINFQVYPDGGDPNTYEIPSLIPFRIKEVIKEIQKDPKKLWYFYERFLQIHFFGDGNGRTARILLALLEPLPVLFYNREKYISLFECRDNNELEKVFNDAIENSRGTVLYLEK